MTPEISCLHATARPQMAIACYEEWESKAKDFSRVQWVFGIDAEDRITMCYISSFLSINNRSENAFIAINRSHKTCNAAINSCAIMSDGNRLVDVCDDVGCPQDWDEIIVQAMPDPCANMFLRFGDGQHSELCAHPVITRKRYEMQQYFMHPDYNSFHGYSDEDATLRARKDGSMVERLDVIFEHRHPAFGKGEWDEVYRRGKADGDKARNVLWMHHPETRNR